jgi:hypothetical protein
MSSSPLFLLLHIPTNTYYGTRSGLRRWGGRSGNTHQRPMSIRGTTMRPRYNIVGFERFADANHVANSVATYRSVYCENPSERGICLYTDGHLLIHAIEHDLWITEVERNDFLERSRHFNLGLSIVHEISPPDITGNITVHIREYTPESDRHSNFDFVDSLEYVLDLPFGNE